MRSASCAKENGRLAVSYAQLAIHAGVQEREIAGALAELVDLGLVVINRRGQRPNGRAKTRPNLYRLTFFPDYEGGWPTDEWQRFDPSQGTDGKAWSAALARAKRIAHAARKRRKDGKPPLRSEAEADGTIAPVEIALEDLGKGKKIGRPGNKQTRAALVEQSRFPRYDSYPHHGTDHTVETAQTTDESYRGAPRDESYRPLYSWDVCDVEKGKLQ